MVPIRTKPDPDVLARAVFADLVRIAEGLGITVTTSRRPGVEFAAEGLFMRKTATTAARIIIDEALGAFASARALAHELAHAVLHGDEPDTSVAQQEIEAEAAAFAFLRVMGLDTLESSLEYISRWASCDDDVRQTQPRVTHACDLILARRAPRAF